MRSSQRKRFFFSLIFFFSSRTIHLPLRKQILEPSLKKKKDSSNTKVKKRKKAKRWTGEVWLWFLSKPWWISQHLFEQELFVLWNGTKRSLVQIDTSQNLQVICPYSSPKDFAYGCYLFHFAHPRIDNSYAPIYISQQLLGLNRYRLYRSELNFPADIPSPSRKIRPTLSNSGPEALNKYICYI